MAVTLTLEQYQALATLARKGKTADELRAVNFFLKDIEKTNKLTRYSLWIQWQEANAPIPATSNFPTVWPPEMRYFMERLDRPITKSDVEAVLQKVAKKPVTVMVTPDPGAALGWTLLNDYFAQ